MNTRPRSPHEKTFMQRQGVGRYDVTNAQIRRRQASARPPGPTYKSTTSRMMDAAGRGTKEPGQAPPVRPRLR